MFAIRSFLPIFLIASAASAAEFPLETGNQWHYRQQGGTATRMIMVGLPYLIGGNVYYQLDGYVDARLLVRSDGNGNLYFRDEERDADALLTSFEAVDGGWFDAPYRPCEQQGRTEAKPVRYEGPSGRYSDAREIRYRSFGCADAGVEHEIYVSRIGMVRRVETTIAGPAIFDLVYARVGNLMVAPLPAVVTRLTVEPMDETKLLATLRLSNLMGHPVRLDFATGQEFDAELTGPDGRILWRWSWDKAFHQAMWSRDLTSELVYQFEMPVSAFAPGDGLYQLEAWIASGPGSGRQFAAVMAVGPPQQ